MQSKSIGILLLFSVAFLPATGPFESFAQWRKGVSDLPQWVNEHVSLQEATKIRTAFASRKIDTVYQNVSTVPDLTWHEFKRVLDLFYATMGSGAVRNKNNWVNGPIDWTENTVLSESASPPADFFTPEYDEEKESVIHQHYVQKVRVPVGDKVIFHGDLHGDVHSLLESISPYLDANNSFKIKYQNLYMVFLGDYVDRGLYGYECIYTLMRLKIDNPDRVFLCRGNHEDGPISDAYGFAYELENKLSSERFVEAKKAIYSMYSILPAAVYLGSGDDFILCCHGGIELGFDPRLLLNTKPELNNSFAWLSVLHQKKLVQEVMGAACAACHTGKLHDNIIPIYNSGTGFFDATELQTKRRSMGGTLGFLWNDFCVDPKQEERYNSGRGWMLGKNITVRFLEKCSDGRSNLRSVFRAHQHTPQVTDALMRLLIDLDGTNPENKGIAKLWDDGKKKVNQLWDGMVVTFNLSPGSLFGFPFQDWPGFDFDTVGELTTAKRFDDWSLVVKRLKTMSLPLYGKIGVRKKEPISVAQSEPSWAARLLEALRQRFKNIFTASYE
jgi:hypothetical protein